MGVESTTDDYLFATPVAWRNGAIAGLLATVVMGLAISLGNLPILRDAIAGLYGQQGSLLAGWLAHLIHGTIFGVLFAAVLADPGVVDVPHSARAMALAGTVFGLVLGVVGAGFVLPMWFSAINPGTMSVPTITTPLLIWHALYGVVLGLGFALLERRHRTGPDD